MTLRIFIPLHTDRTLFDGRPTHSPRLENIVDGAADALADELSAVAAAHWPQLRQICVNCWLIDRDAALDKDSRFDKKNGQWSLGLSLDAGGLAAMGDPDGALWILMKVAAVMDAGLERQSQQELRSALQSAIGAWSGERLAEFGESFADEFEDDDAAPASLALTAEADGRIRHLGALPAKRGELWIMLGTQAGYDERAANTVLDRIETCIREAAQGKQDGRSFGPAVFDASFRVKNVKQAGDILDAFMRQQLPKADYVISDDFEVVFDAQDERRTAPSEFGGA